MHDYSETEEEEYTPYVPRQRATAGRPTTTRQPVQRLTSPKTKVHGFTFYTGSGVIIACLGIGLWLFVIAPWLSGIVTQWHYGDAQVATASADVGHGGVSNFFSYEDSDGRIVVIEIVGQKYRVFSGVDILAGGHHVITMTIQDAGNGRPDLILRVSGMEDIITLWNTGTDFSFTK